MRRGAAALLLVGALLAACGSSEPTATDTADAKAFTGSVTAFYAPPVGLAGRHGSLLRYSALDPVGGTKVFRVLYRSRSVQGKPIAVSGIVLVPEGDGPHPVLTYAHGTAGLADRCAPSKQPVYDVLTDLAGKGYVVTATDYEGLGTPGLHPYIAGISEGRSTLDIVRAAAELPGVELDAKTVIWGHSQGGHAAVFAAQLAPTWTPELDVVGTVAIAPATELPLIASALKNGPYQGYLAMAAGGLHAAYPDADLHQILTDEAIGRLGILETACTAAVWKAFRSLPYDRFAKADPTSVPAWKALLEENDPGHVKLSSPLFIVHGEADEQIPTVASAALFNRLCRLGQVAERKTYPGADHVGVAEAALDDLVRWTAERFAGKPATNGCSGA
jgi:acetyl esterase/lipase